MGETCDKRGGGMGGRRNWKTGGLIRGESADKREVRHTKTLVCNQVIGAV